MILEEEYKSRDAMSQSLLKKILVHPNLFLGLMDDSNETKEDKTHFRLGSAMDILLTGREEDFDKVFSVANVPEPVGQLGVYTTTYFKEELKQQKLVTQQILPDINYAEIRLIAHAKCGTKKSVEDMHQIFETDGGAISYYEFLKVQEQKVVLSITEYDMVRAAADSLRTHEFTKHLFTEDPNISLLYQVPIYWTEKRGRMVIKCKALLDLVIANHKNRTLRPLDFKSMSRSTGSFVEYNFWKLRYDFQAAWYTRGLEHWQAQEKLFKDYAILNFQFAIENLYYPGNPLIYETSPDVLSVGRYGGTVNGKTYKGFEEALDRYCWHSENNVWAYTKEDYLNKGLRYITY